MIALLGLTFLVVHFFSMVVAVLFFNPVALVFTIIGIFVSLYVLHLAFEKLDHEIALSKREVQVNDPR